MKTLFTTVVLNLILISSVFGGWEKCDGPYDGIVEKIKRINNSLYFFVTHRYYYTYWKEASYVKLDFSAINPMLNDYDFISFNYSRDSFFATNEGLYVSDGYHFRNVSNDNFWAPKNIFKLFFIGDKLIVYTDKGVYRYIGGVYNSKWILLEKINANILLKIGDQQFAATNDGLFTKDKDSTWVAIDLGIDLAVNDMILSGTQVFAATNKGIYISQDSGSTWGHFGKSGQDNYYKIADFDSYIYTCSKSGFYRISFDLNEFENLNYNLPFTHVTSFEFLEDKVHIGTKGAGVFYKQIQDTVWNLAAISTKMNRIKHFEDEFIICSLSGLHQSLDSGLTWRIMDLPGYYVMDYFKDDNFAYVATENNIYRKKHGDTDWSDITINNDNDDEFKYKCIIGAGNKLFIGTDRGLFQSHDFGKSWYQISQSILINSLSINNDDLFIIASDCLYKANLNLSEIKLERVLPVLFIKSIAFKGNDIYVSNNTRLYKSMDRGNTFTEITQPNINGYYDIAVNGNTIYVGSNIEKIIVSHDDGQTWHLESLGNDSNQTNRVYCFGNYLLAGTTSKKGIFNLSRSKISTLTTDINIDHNKTNNFQIHPNPATEYIEITKPSEGFKPSEGSDVKIFNILGECVLTVGARRAVPLKKVDISHLPRGVYYLRFGSQTQMFLKI
jgi:hypothetical protein